MSYITSLSYAEVTKWGTCRDTSLTAPYQNTGLLFCLTPPLGLLGTLLSEVVFTNMSLLVPGANRKLRNVLKLGLVWKECGRSTCEEPGIVAALQHTEPQAETLNHQQNILSSPSLCGTVKMMMTVFIPHLTVLPYLPLWLDSPRGSSIKPKDKSVAAHVLRGNVVSMWPHDCVTTYTSASLIFLKYKTWHIYGCQAHTCTHLCTSLTHSPSSNTERWCSHMEPGSQTNTTL